MFLEIKCLLASEALREEVPDQLGSKGAVVNQGSDFRETGLKGSPGILRIVMGWIASPKFIC